MGTEVVSADEVQIRNIINTRAKAIQDKDINQLMSFYAADIVEFDAVTPLQYRGIAAPRQRAEEWFSSYRGSIGYEVRDLEIIATKEIAFSHFLYRISGIMANNSAVDMWLRATLGLQKRDGSWQVTHEHSSVPFYVESGKAAVDLKP